MRQNPSYALTSTDPELPGRRGLATPRYPNVHLFMRYLYEFWRQVGINSNLEGTPQGRFGFFDNQGLVIQAGLDF
ncbi:MAG: hypothetical protein ACLP7Q_17305 [Isosphaeraceae bacterium]